MFLVFLFLFFFHLKALFGINDFVLLLSAELFFFYVSLQKQTMIDFILKNLASFCCMISKF